MYPSYSPSISQLQRQSSFSLVEDIWFLNNFSSHCDLAKGWDMKKREGKNKKRNRKKKKSKNEKGQRETLLMEKGGFRP